MTTAAERRARWDRWHATYEATVTAHRDGLSVRKIAEAIGLSPSRVHQILRSPEVGTWEWRLDLLRTHGWPSPEDPPRDAPSGDTIADRLMDEAQALRDVTDWLDKLVRTGMPELLELRPRSDHPPALPQAGYP